MLWFAVTFMGESILKLIPSSYSEDLVRYKWLVLGLGIFLSITGFVNKLKQKRGRNRNDTRWHKNNSNIIRKDFESEQKQEQFQTSYAKKFDNKTNKKLYRQTAVLNDLAKKIEWSPIAGGGANFKTSYLHQSNQSRVEILKSNGGKLFSAVFIGMGVIIPAIIIFSIIKEDGFDWQILFPFLIGSIFTAVGIVMLFFPKPRVFDKQTGWFWAGSKQLSSEQELSLLKKSTRLNEIAAIQIIPERLSGKNSTYTSWEINLISHDAQRLNVMDHGNKRSIQQDAQKLSEFLGVPVWENV